MPYDQCKLPVAIIVRDHKEHGNCGNSIAVTILWARSIRFDFGLCMAGNRLPQTCEGMAQAVICNLAGSQHDSRLTRRVQCANRPAWGKVSHRPLFQHQTSYGTPAQMPVDAFNDDRRKVLEFERKRTFDPDDKRSGFSGSVTRPVAASWPVNLERARELAQPLADNLGPQGYDLSPGKALLRQHGRKAAINQVGKRFRWHGGTLNPVVTQDQGLSSGKRRSSSIPGGNFCVIIYIWADDCLRPYTSCLV